MNKVIKVSINKTPFTLAEDAYSVLKVYLDHLRRHRADRIHPANFRRIAVLALGVYLRADHRGPGVTRPRARLWQPRSAPAR